MNKNVIIGIVGIVVVVGIIGILIGTANRNNSQTGETSNTPEISENAQSNQAATIIVTETGFEPTTITVQPGTRVTWINKSGDNVSLASADHPTHQTYTPLNLGEFGVDSSVQLVFDQAGTYSYHDHYNPERTGQVIVK